MDNEQLAKRITERTREHKKDQFGRWIEQPLVRLTLATVPPGDHRDGLRVLLQDAFDSGYAAGQGMMVGSFLEHMFADKRSPR